MLIEIHFSLRKDKNLIKKLTKDTPPFLENHTDWLEHKLSQELSKNYSTSTRVPNGSLIGVPEGWRESPEPLF